ncbi:MAG: Ig-like domain-containing protein [Bacteroidales bacterium]
MVIVSNYSIVAQNFNGGNGDGHAASNLVNSDFNTLPEVFTVTLNLAVTQNDTTNALPIQYTVVFNRTPVDFSFDDITWSGTAVGITGNIIDNGTSFTVNVDGMTSEGTLIATISANKVHDGSGNGNQQSVSITNYVLFETLKPGVEITKASGQSDSTLIAPVNFKAKFTEPVTGFDNSDVIIGGSANPANVVVTGVGDEYNIAVDGMTSDGFVSVSVNKDVCIDLAGNYNTKSLNTDTSVYFQVSDLTVIISPAVGQADTTNQVPLVFEVVFNRSVTGFSFDDITWTGTALVTSGIITGTGAHYTVNVNAIGNDGTLSASLPYGVVNDALGVGNQPSGESVPVVYDVTKPVIEILSEPGQPNPTNSSVISFRAVFSEKVQGFVPANVSIGGTTGANLVNLRGGPINYTIDISGMTIPGEVSVTIAADLMTDAAGNMNLESINTENTVLFDNLKPNITVSSSETSPTNSDRIPLLFEFDKEVSGFEVSDINISNGSIEGFIETVSGKTWEAFIIPLSEGIINVQVPADAINDISGNSNNASNHFQIEYINEFQPVFEANNIFTPNSEKNKYWLIKNVSEFADFELIIRNSAGLIVYQTRNYQNNWNGTYNNNPLPTGTYYYTFSNSSVGKVYKGFINIILE